MKEIDIPLIKSKEWVSTRPKKCDYFEEQIKELRIQLNKLARNNFHRIAEKIVINFKYTPRLMDNLAVDTSHIIYYLLEIIV